MEKKLLQEELDEAKKLQQEKENLTFRLGELAAAKVLLDAEQEKVNGFYLNLEKENKRFLDELIQKYGQGKISLETGIFTPDT